MRSLTPWKTSPQLSGLHEEIDDLFERFFGGDLGTRRTWPGSGRFAPAIESFLKEDKLVVRADLPGIDPKEVDVQVEGDRLTIRGERRQVHEDKNRSYREVTYGRFERTVRLPSGVDPDTVKATYTDGVLEIAMDAPKSLTSKKVEIAVH
jgi:HSP20 family protein